MRMGIVALVLTAAPAAALAQGRPGTNLIIDVHVTRVTLSSGTGRVEYGLSNHGDSQEELYTFTVDAPAPVLRISAPTSDDWATATSYRGRSVADWAALTRQLPPGATAAPFAFEAGGLPGIVTMWIRGYYPPPELTTENQGAPRHPSDPLAENSIRGRTVGLERFPADQSPAGLLDRLRGLGRDRHDGDHAGEGESLERVHRFLLRVQILKNGVPVGRPSGRLTIRTSPSRKRGPSVVG